jgi:hypothetical protein
MTPDEQAERYRLKDEADREVYLSVTLSDPKPEWVDARPIPRYPGRAVVYLAGNRIQATITGSITGLRAVAVEIDRQLARLEVEATVDATAEDES